MVKPQGTTDLFLADPNTPQRRYCAQTTWEQLLIPDGWTFAKTDRHGEQHWTRPGKDSRDGISATIGHNGNDALIVFTSAVSHGSPKVDTTASDTWLHVTITATGNKQRNNS
jgi:hypothetical protein